MKKTLLTLVTVLVCAMSLKAQISDNQVIEMIRQASERGMSQTDIASELLQRGVTQQQLLRISGSASSNSGVNSLSGSGSNNSSLGTMYGGQDSQNRLRSDPRLRQIDGSDNTIMREGMMSTTMQSALRGEELPRDEKGRLLTRDMTTRQMQLVLDSMLLEADKAKKSPIFGHNVFSNKELTFEPLLNIATPENYVLGPGDEVIIDIWGESEQTIRQTISPDGTIVVRQLGPVSLGGSTVKDADAKLKRSLGAIYSSAFGDAPGTFIKLSLGQIRTIKVHVMGEVENPGSYSLPSLASLFHVLYSAGGVNEIGSLREISVSRGGVRIATVDVYAYLLEGRSDADIALADGDVVVVPPYRNLVEVAGGVKRPMKYEMKDRQTLGTLLDYAGGFAGGSFRDAVTVVRRSERLREVYDVGRGDYAHFALADGDSIAVGKIIDRFANRLEITGAVFRPGLYSVAEGVTTLKGLVERAEGVMGDAAVGRALLTREKADYTLEMLPVDVGAILAGVAPDIALRNNDKLHIPSLLDLREQYTVTIRGEVQKPGVYEYADNLSIEDMVIAAGGLRESASMVRADVDRRIKNPGSMSESEVRSETFSFPVRWEADPVEGHLTGPLTGDEEGGFKLLPFDIVTIRTSPGYEVQKPVAVLGEVLFPGDYSLVKREERLSDLIHKAGGPLTSAYLRGAKLVRKRAEDEQTRAQSALRLAQMGGRDSLSTSSLNVDQNYSVGIELDKALAWPGSDYDLVLTEGDVLFVPEYVGTVAVSGAVLFPNTVSYREGMSIGDYIDQAGGYAHRARKRAKIVVYMNGTIARVRSLKGAKIAPGSEIVVPYKSYKNSARASVSDLLSVGASATSAASLVTTIANTFK